MKFGFICIYPVKIVLVYEGAGFRSGVLNASVYPTDQDKIPNLAETLARQPKPDIK